MSKKKLIDTVSQIGQITEFEKKLIDDNFIIENYKKNQILVNNEEDCNKIFFVIKGILRVYHNNLSSTEITRTFIFENNFCTNLISFSGQGINNETIQALEDTITLAIKRENFYKMLDHSPILLKLYTKFLEQFINTNLYQFEFLNTLTERQRVEKCLNEFPEIINRVKDKIVATYIGVTPEFFSRVKSEILKKANN